MAKTKYNSIEALNPIRAIINDTTAALNQPSRTLKDSEIKEVLGTITGGGITSGLAAKGFLGGFMVAGISTFAAPVAILGVGGYALISQHKKNKIKEEKEILLKEAIAKQTAIIKDLENKLNITRERAEYLNQLNLALQYTIKDLKDDLGYAV